MVVDAAVSVRGYYRKNGTYVEPHYRSDPDSSPYNNWSYPGNINPYTNKIAPGNSSTYLDNYRNSSLDSFKHYVPSTPTIRNGPFSPLVDTDQHFSGGENYEKNPEYIKVKDKYESKKCNSSLLEQVNENNCKRLLRKMVDLTLTNYYLPKTEPAQNKNKKLKNKTISTIAKHYAALDDCENDLMTDFDQRQCKTFINSNMTFNWTVENYNENTYLACGKNLFKRSGACGKNKKLACTTDQAACVDKE